MHLCLNIVAGKKNTGGAVLIRGGETYESRAIIGPGRVGKYLQITKEMNGISIISSSIARLGKAEPIPDFLISSGPRIGVKYANEWALKPLRFWYTLPANAKKII